MPLDWVSAYAKMMPRLQAEDTLRLVNATSFAFGSMKEDDAKAYSRSLQKQAGMERPVKRATNKDIREIFGGPAAAPVKKKG